MRELAMISTTQMSEAIQKEYHALLEKDLDEKDIKRLMDLFRSSKITEAQVRRVFLEVDKKYQGMKYQNRDCGLFDAIEDGNKEAVEWLIKKGGHQINCAVYNINRYRYMLNPTPLSFAINECNSPQMVDLLLSLGASIDDYTIHYAKTLASHKDNRMMEILKKYGYQPQQKEISETQEPKSSILDLKTLADQNKILSEKLKEAEMKLTTLKGKLTQLVLEDSHSNINQLMLSHTNPDVVTNIQPASNLSSATQIKCNL